MRTTALVPLITGLCAAFGCGSSTAPAVPDPTALAVTTSPAATGAKAATADAVATPQPGAKPSSTPPGKLLVGGELGLVEYDMDGKQIAKLTRVPAMRPRKLADGAVLFLERSSEGAAIILKRQDPSGGEAQVARLATGYDDANCKLAGAAPGDKNIEPMMAVQSDWGFRVDHAAGAACITIADRNENMAEVSFDFRVDLASKQVQSTLTMDDAFGCTVGKPLECKGRLAPPPNREAAEAEIAAQAKLAANWPWAFDPTTLRLYPQGKPKAADAVQICMPGTDVTDDDARDAGCAAAEGRSSSGRFVLLSGPTSEGDYIHRELFILDLKGGEVWGLMGDPRGFQKVQPGDVLAEGTGSIDAVGESDVRWLGHDRLWIDGHLVNPAQRAVVSLTGDLAW